MKKKRSQRHISQLLQYAELLIPLLIFLSIYFYRNIADLAFPQPWDFNLLFVPLLPCCIIPIALLYTAITRIKSRNKSPTKLRLFSTLGDIHFWGVF